MSKTICLISLGCHKNLVDSEVILGLLSKEGYLPTTDPSIAETLIVNTCAFIEDATKEAIETIRRAQPLPPIPPELPDRLNIHVQLVFDPS